MGCSVLIDEPDGSTSEDGVLLLFVTEDVSVSSGIVANFFRTCFKAGRRIGLLEEKVRNVSKSLDG